MRSKPCDKCNGTAYLSGYCGAYVCSSCSSHVGLSRCYCGWSADGGDGRRQLEDCGETIDPEPSVIPDDRFFAEDL